MEQRVLLAAGASVVVFVAIFVILWLGDRERARTASLVSVGVPRGYAPSAEGGLAGALALIGGRMPSWLGSIPSLRVSLPAFVNEESRSEWERFRVGLTASIGLLSIAIALVLQAPALLVLLPLSPALASVITRNRLRRLESERLRRIDAEFVNALDIIVLAMEAGLGLDRAIAAYTAIRDSDLSGELRGTTRELEVGYRRREALQRLVERTGSSRLASFAGAVRVAEEFGSPLAAQLRSLSREVRAERKQKLQEMALKAPVTMLLPTAAFILPPIFAIVMGPMIMRLVSGSLF